MDSPFLEDNAIRLAIEAARQDDPAAAELDRVLDKFLDGELSRLHHGAHYLAEQCEVHLNRRLNRRPAGHWHGSNFHEVSDAD